MNLVIEEAMTNMIRRIEVLEEKMSRLCVPNKNGLFPLIKNGLASEGQLKYIKILKG